MATSELAAKPWSVGKRISAGLHAETVSHAPVHICVTDADGRVVAEVDNRPGREANARLIAAAPLLLEALEGMVNRTERLAEFYSDLDDAPDGAVPAWDLLAISVIGAKAAIAAARGEGER